MNERTIERMNEGEGTMLFAQERECVRACVTEEFFAYILTLTIYIYIYRACFRACEVVT